MVTELSFVIITWNSEKTIEECLRGIREKCTSEKIEYEIFVVDNGSKDSTVETIKRNAGEMPVILTELHKNIGTTKSRNMAFKQCTGKVICVLDSDAVFFEGNLRDAADTLLKDDSCGILAPKLIFPDGSIQESVLRFPSIFGKFSKIPAIVFKLKLKESNGYENFPFSETTEVDYSISACWLFRRELLDEVGYLDEKIFYSPEDVDYGIRIWKKGKKTLYYPNLIVLHHVQRLTHKKFFSRIAISHLFGLIYYFLKHRYFKTPRKNEY